MLKSSSVSSKLIDIVNIYAIHVIAIIVIAIIVIAVIVIAVIVIIVVMTMHFGESMRRRRGPEALAGGLAGGLLCEWP